MISTVPVIIDASTLLNLLATGRIEEILLCVADHCYICQVVEGECLSLRSADGSRVEPVSVLPIIEIAALRRCVMTEEEADEYVTLAGSIDDGEAMSLAIAHARGFSLVTDDRKARNHAVGLGVSVFGTSAIMRAWGDSVTDVDIGAVLGTIERRARFRPPDDDINCDWWMSLRK